MPQVEAAEVGDDLVPADEDAAMVRIGLLLAPLVEAVAFLPLHAEVGLHLPIAVDQPRPQHAILRDVHLAPRQIGIRVVLHRPIGAGRGEHSEQGEGEKEKSHWWWVEVCQRGTAEYFIRPVWKSDQIGDRETR